MSMWRSLSEVSITIGQPWDNTNGSTQMNRLNQLAHSFVPTPMREFRVVGNWGRAKLTGDRIHDHRLYWELCRLDSIIPHWFNMWVIYTLLIVLELILHDRGYEQARDGAILGSCRHPWRGTAVLILVYRQVCSGYHTCKAIYHWYMFYSAQELKNRGIDPEFTLSDKDKSDINALRTVWPNAKHHLCIWDVLRAIRHRLAW